jgi:hypothetical protein
MFDVFSIYAIMAKYRKTIPLTGIARKGLPELLGTACLNMKIISVDTKKNTNKVTQIVSQYQGGWLGVSPGGTRSFRPYIRAGFYHMAKECNVPIVFSNADFRHNTVSFSRPLDVSHMTKEETIQAMLEYYSTHNLVLSGKYSTNANVIQLKTSL